MQTPETERQAGTSEDLLTVCMAVQVCTTEYQ